MKKIFFLRSGVRNALANAVSTPALPLLFDSPVVAERVSGPPRPRRTGRLYQGIAVNRASSTAPTPADSPAGTAAQAPDNGSRRSTRVGRPAAEERALEAQSSRREIQ
ncbi:hypothetical protein GCM10009616_22590 [Microlunatus lacustris]